MAYEIDGTLHQIFVDNMKARRIELGLTQAEAAKRMGRSQPSYAQIESGRGSPSLDTVEEVAKALHCSPQQLLLQSAFVAAEK